MKLITQPPVKKNLTIEFTPDELQALIEVVGMVTGPDDGPRSHMNKLWGLLVDEGYLYNCHKVTGTIHLEART